MNLKAIRAGIIAALLFPTGLYAQAETDAPLVKLFEVSADSGDLNREFYGHVAARETVELAFQVGGQIVELPIVEGQTIEAGSAVAQLDTAPYEIARDQAAAQNDQAKRTVDRLSQLSGSSVSQVTVDDARTQLELSAIALRDAERALSNTTLLAPFDALVATRNVANFSTVSAGTPIVRLHDMSRLHIDIDVPEILFQRTGNTVDATIEAVFPGIDARFPLRVQEFNAETSQAGQTFGITFSMAPPEDHVILPGASVTVLTRLKGIETGVVIPGSALVFTPDGATQVMRYTPDADDLNRGAVTAVNVTVAPSDTGEITVIEGLEPGDLIVGSGAEQLRDADRVRRFTGFTN